MIQLQSVFSQRQTASALTQNLPKSLHERFHLEDGTDLPGNDYIRYRKDNLESCRIRCAGDGSSPL
jgi:hypothetical protein